MAGSSRTEAIVLANCLSRVFTTGARRVSALAEASCSVWPGDRIAIIGASGSGKSTLLNLLAGLDSPTAGVVSWPALGAASELRPCKVSVVFQAASLLPSLTAQENVALPLLLSSGADDAQLVAREALERLGLADLAAKLPEELSGGQAQRVAMARAICGRPKLIIADEPTGQLDGATAKNLFDRVLETIAPESALVVATHDETIAARMPIVWRMKDGRLSTRGEAAVS
jgi:putative ABC transport system ATP-binding protein/lipoprotein-releasing system ATP-binding protein